MSAGGEDNPQMSPEQEFLAAAAAARARSETRDAETARPEGLDSDEVDAAQPTASKPTGGETTIPAAELERLTEDMIAAIKTVYDPEIPVDIYELGLIYRIDVDDDRNVDIDMTLTAPACPVAGDMPVWVENAVRSVAGVQDVKVQLVFDPPWDKSRMSEEAQVALNMF